MKLKPVYQRLTPSERLYHLDIPLIGLTGGIATGKSTMASLLKKKGLAVVNADELVKSIYTQAETQDFLRQHHPEVMTDSGVDFRALREKVFREPSAKVQIEQFIYQRLPEAFTKAKATLGNPRLIIYDIPLLFEKKLEPHFDLSVLVYAPRETQRRRLIIRDGISEELADRILNQQLDIEVKKSLAGIVIDNSGFERDLTKEVEQFLRKVLD